MMSTAIRENDIHGVLPPNTFAFETLGERSAKKCGPRDPVKVYLWLAIAGGRSGSQRTTRLPFSFCRNYCCSGSVATITVATMLGREGPVRGKNQEAMKG
jgi:hypothetical protein